jgi:hypothetical protein
MKPAIDNPRHSRPIDVHRWSDHPEVKALVEDIWESYLPWQITGKTKLSLAASSF